MYHKFRHFRSKHAIEADIKRAEIERMRQRMRQRKRKRTLAGDFIPAVGDRVEVLFDQRFWYGGTVNRKKKDTKAKDENAVMLHINYDDGEDEWAKFPDTGNIKLSQDLSGAGGADSSIPDNKAGSSNHYEPVGWMSMTIQDYGIYLQVRAAWMEAKEAELKKQRRASASPTATPIAELLEAAGLQRHMTVTDCKNALVQVDVAEDVLYLIDLPVPSLLPELHADLNRNFLLPEALPGGTHCLQQYVAVTGRPFMGPNLYVTPPGAVTWFHEDGHGTVDSGHQCLLGENEVIMLRRMPEEHKQKAIKLLASNQDYNLRDKPHDAGDKPQWPTKKQIKKLRKLGYAPSCFVLGPGEFVHINKGRLHAFQKKMPSPGKPDQICVSLAWDWMFQGVTAEGFEAEAKTALASAHHNHKSKVASLGITETALLQAAKVAAADMVSIQRQQELFSEIPHACGKRLQPSTHGESAGGAINSKPGLRMGAMATMSTLLRPPAPSSTSSCAKNESAKGSAEQPEEMEPAATVLAATGGWNPLTPPLQPASPGSESVPPLNYAASAADTLSVLHGVAPCVQQIFERLGTSVKAVADALHAHPMSGPKDTNLAYIPTDTEEAHAKPVQIRVGTKIEGRWEDDEWYPAVVRAVKRKRGSTPHAYTIRYEEDGVENIQKADRVRLPQPPKVDRASNPANSASSSGPAGMKNGGAVKRAVLSTSDALPTTATHAVAVNKSSAKSPIGEPTEAEGSAEIAEGSADGVKRPLQKTEATEIGIKDVKRGRLGNGGGERGRTKRNSDAELSEEAKALRAANP
jgi:hypothetical protein